MAKVKPLTIPNLIGAMKDAGFATKTDMPSILKEYGVATKDDVENSVLASERRMKLRLGKVRNDLAQRIAKVAITSHAEYLKLKLKVESSYS